MEKMKNLNVGDTYSKQDEEGNDTKYIVIDKQADECVVRILSEKLP